MDLREELVRHYHWLRQYGYNDSHSGNASLRTDNDVWVTPSGCCADLLQADELLRCPIGEAPVAGASLDAPLHLAVYAARPEARAILHSHGPYSVAMTMDGEDFLPVDFEGQHYFEKVPVIDIPYAQYVELAPARVAEALAEFPVAVVRGHGVYARAESINLAYKWTCSFELSAKTAYLARQAGTIK